VSDQDAERFRYLLTIVQLQTHRCEDGALLEFGMDMHDLHGVEFKDTPTFREVVDAMRTNATKPFRGH
jgi:hypothetical protein